MGLTIETEKMDAQKLRGGYYTPNEIADFICKWAIDESTLRVLEPSCGDGNFIESAILRFKELGIIGNELVGRIKGIELIPEESLKAKDRAKQLGLNSTTIVNSDFFHYTKSNGLQKYDAVLGNPPFIRFQNFPHEHRILATEMMQDLNMKPNGLTNIWVPFLVVSASLLNEQGKLGMVIPAELFQVKYAAETRIFLSQFFKRITIITFKKLVFSDIQQEVVLLLCEKSADAQTGIRVIECNNLSDLRDFDFNVANSVKVKPIDHTTEKWTKYFLDENEIDLLRRLKNDNRIISCSDLMEVDVGLVTGRNEFFILNESQVKEWGLQRYTIPVASKSNQLRGINFQSSDLANNSKVGSEMYLFIPPEKDFEDLPKKCQEYVRYGEKKNYHKGYKTRIRKRWYITPSLWVPDGFALRQINDHPRIILNATESSSTDTIHRVRFRRGVSKKQVAVSFLNSLTFAFSEVTGRSYGGGVMTFEPSEIEELRIPKPCDFNFNFKEIDGLIRERKIHEVLDHIDNELLVGKIGLHKDEVTALRNIWLKLSDRRINRKRR